MKQAALLAGVLALASLFLISCGSSRTGSTAVTGLKFRAFITQNVVTATVSSGLDIINASTDQLARAPGISDLNQPGMMAVAQNKVYTLVFDAGNNAINVINNKQETPSASIPLPSWTESMVISPDASVGYAAVKNAPQAGLAPGAVEMLNLSNFTLAPPIPIPSVHYVVLSPDATHLLAFSDNSDTANLVSFENTGTNTSPSWVLVPPTATKPNPLPIGGLNRPVWAVFSADGLTAYVLNCGGECGSVNSPTASVSVLDVGSGALMGSPLAIPGGATYGTLFGSTLYVAGSAPANASSCSSTSNVCGTLSVISVGNGTLQLTNQVSITNGYHNRMAVTADNQVFIGARCNPSPGSNAGATFGCLSLFNEARNATAAVIGPDVGDVTGIAPVTGRTEVYVVQNGELRIWDTTTDALKLPQFQLDLLGNAVDVKIVD